jgi:DNA topoisomerase-1
MKLVVVESPAKCSKIKSFLGAGYNVIASMGHIRALQQNLDAVGIDRDFTPTYTFMEEKAKAIAGLRAAAKGCDQVILAADDDREGEAIAYSVCELLRLKPADTHRAVFHEITEKAVKAAVANPRRLDMNRVNAQQARAMLDMMIGFTISPLLWKHVAPGLSAGRCQTPALRFIVEKEQECEGHTVSSSWKITGKWTAAAGAQPFPATLDDPLMDEESARAYLEMRRETEWAVVRKAVTKPWSASAPAPLITSTLQQEASALFHTPPKSTMKAAQKLYEAGHITYMRTDSAVLSEEASQAAKDLVTARFGADYVGAVQSEAVGAVATALPKKTAKKATAATAAQPEAPKAQEAHEAIRPTHFELEALSADEDWTHQERQIYKLIWQRAVQSVMAAAKGEARTVEFYPDDEEDFNWTAVWRRTTFPGWKALGVKQANLDEDSADETDSQTQTQVQAWTAATALTVGMQLKWAEIQATPHETKAPPRYTEATLVRDLEKRGIGRPSTFASLIASIMDKEYVETKDIAGKEITQKTLTLTPSQWPPQETTQKRTVGAEKRKVVPTALGRSVYEFALKHFNDLFDYSFTASMENRLDHIAAGEEGWKGVLQDTWASYKDRYTTLNATTATAATGQKGKLDPARQRDMGDGLKVIQSRKGPLLLIEPTEEGAKAKFFSLPPKATFESLTPEAAHTWVKAQKGETISAGGGAGGSEAEGQIVRKKGPYGWYAQCGDIRASCGEHDTCEELEEKIAAKRAGAAATSPAVKVGTYEFKTGAYGPYMYKTDLKTRKFVSIPAGTDTSNLTQKDADALYKAGLEKKSKAAPSNWKRASAN